MKFIPAVAFLLFAFSASAQVPRPIEGGWFLPNGWTITPVGEHLPAKDAVLNLALSPDGKHMAALSCGYNEHEVLLIDTQTGKAVQRLVLPTAWLGLAWAPNGETLYVSGGNRKQEKAKAAPVFAIPFEKGKLSRSKMLELRDTMPRAETFWTGIVHHPSKPLLYAASRMTGEVVIFDTTSGTVSGRVKVERDPYDLVISPDGAHLYCSNWGSDSLSVIDLNTNTVLRTAAAGDNPNDMTLLPDGPCSCALPTTTRYSVSTRRRCASPKR